jgi:hypothetical protein
MSPGEREQAAMTRIPNAMWLGFGIVFSLSLLWRLPFNPYFLIYFMVGIPIAAVLLMFYNPKSQPNALPILASLWPFALLALIVARPWNSRQWKNRNTEQKPSPAAPEGDQN